MSQVFCTDTNLPMIMEKQHTGNQINVESDDLLMPA